MATPDEPSDAAMLDALFQAIGIEGSSASRNPHKRRKLISEALQYSRITCIFDEAQFLFPPALNRTDAHHVFPRNYLKGQGLSRGRYNQIANHVLAQSEINIAIGDKPPEK